MTDRKEKTEIFLDALTKLATEFATTATSFSSVDEAIKGIEDVIDRLFDLMLEKGNEVTISHNEIKNLLLDIGKKLDNMSVNIINIEKINEEEKTIRGLTDKNKDDLNEIQEKIVKKLEESYVSRIKEKDSEIIKKDKVIKTLWTVLISVVAAVILTLATLAGVQIVTGVDLIL